MIYFAPGTFNYSKKGVPNLDILKKIKKKTEENICCDFQWNIQKGIIKSVNIEIIIE